MTLADADVLRGLLYAHDRANANTATLHETSSTLDAVVELLVAEGILDPDRLATARAATAPKRERQFYERGMAVAMQSFDDSKYAFEGGAEIDCAGRLPLCGAACCKLPVALSKEDVEEGVLRWELGRPYLLLHDADHHCHHLDRGTHRCGAYGARPIPCRAYDCRRDDRIWIDFEAGIVNPAINEPGWPESG
jgi:Putative zinc- or iron-chelating domain